ncbi:MAG: selenocysteine-specific translation elongation factor [Deltaproteobacteria bacterium]|nr:selenocysteine-specific translation elongation factor [Deltaproteobacteria bacterium]
MYVIGTAGHVDHGKSTLLRALTGMEPDRLPEEKKRGMTIDLNFVWFAGSQGKIGIVDVPGHQRFVKNMITGAVAFDAFLLVVAADDGWMPQTEEHAQVLYGLGVEQGLVVITKTDLVEQTRISEVKGSVGERLAQLFGRSYEMLQFSPAELNGAAVIRAKLIELLGRGPRPRNVGKPALWIDRVFLPRGAGVVVTGTLRDGQLNVGQQVTIAPQSVQATIRSLQAYHENVNTAEPTSRVAVGLTRLQGTEVQRGDVLLSHPIAATQMLVSWVHLFADNRDMRCFLGNKQFSFYVGTARQSARVTFWKEAEGGCFAGIKLAQPLGIRSGEHFLLRLFGEEQTVGFGLVIEPVATPKRVAIKGLEGGKPTLDSIVRYCLTREGFLDVDEMAARSIYSREEIEKVLRLVEAVRFSSAKFADKTVFEKNKNTLCELLRSIHGAGKPHVGENSLAKAVSKATGLKEGWVQEVISHLVGMKILCRSDSGLSLFGAQAEDPTEVQAMEEIGSRLATLGVIALKDFGTGEISVLKNRMHKLVKKNRVVALGEDHFIAASTFEMFKQKVLRYLQEKGQSTTSELRTVLNVSRKHVIYLLEKMDEQRLTYLKDGVRRLLR